MEKIWHFKGILTDDGWIDNASVFTDAEGNLTKIDTSGQGNKIDGYALPGFQNAHSHAFQYAMAGLAEYHEGSGIPDDFWSWRTAMYNLALTLSPDDMEAVATVLYSEMLRHGYTSVAEFHYVHHDPDGNPYPNVSEMGERLISAAKKTGIRITLVPMFYQQGNFGQSPVEKQRRFISESIEKYLELLASSAASVKIYDRAKLGCGIHSLRAVKPEDVVKFMEIRDKKLPFHIHVSEQLKEIEDCLDFHGKRPVQWLLDNVKLDENCHLVHATHLDDSEVKNLAKTGAHVVICPSTEGNLGDGLFRFADYVSAGGNWSIGTDSHIGLNPMEELRILDYGQRLISHKRTTFYQADKGDSGFNAIGQAWKSGRKAMGENSDAFFEIGKPFDASVLRADSPLVASASAKNRCNTLVYASDAAHQLGTIVSGDWVYRVDQTNREEIVADFLSVMKKLGTRQ